MKRVFACAVSVAFLGAASLSALGQEAGGYAQGKDLYEEKCQMCHGQNDFTSGNWMRFSMLGLAIRISRASFTSPIGTIETDILADFFPIIRV